MDRDCLIIFIFMLYFPALSICSILPCRARLPMDTIFKVSMDLFHLPRLAQGRRTLQTGDSSVGDGYIIGTK